MQNTSARDTKANDALAAIGISYRGASLSIHKYYIDVSAINCDLKEHQELTDV